MDAVTAFFNELVNDYEEGQMHLLQRNDIRAIEECNLKINDHLHLLCTLAIRIDEGTLQNLLLNLYQFLWIVYTELSGFLEETNQQVVQQSHHLFLSSRNNNGRVGRPSFDITEEQIIYFRRELGLSWTDISGALHISRSTLHRLKNKYNFVDNFAMLSDYELDETILDIMSRTPNSGEVYILGSLRSRGLKVQRWRVRERLNILDPVNRALRRRGAIVRRVYSVKGANYLWHIDSNHKLVSYRMVFHGCIDGYSRCIIYLKCLNDNKADSVLTCFENAVQEFGFPRRVRGDRGTENIEVAHLMITKQGCDRGSFIVGRSVHNQRIERLWSEVNRTVSKHYKTMFLHMEEMGILDENNEIDLFCLSYIFMPRIKLSLEEFVRQWNHHSLSTANHRSPWQIWTLDRLNGNSYTVDEDPNYQVNPREYGVDYMGPLPEIETDNNVVVPQFRLTFTAAQLEEICSVIPNPLAEDNYEGLLLYMQLKELVTRF